MTFTVEQKSQLARLMATENLRVEHQKIQTAKFDTKNRVLYLPIWQDMSGTLYDLLCGHEVGHALYTPAEGWHDAVLDKSKGRHYKHFLNVVEDARIEKKIKRRYPGLKVSFQKAYSELNERDFFGIKNRDINTLPFIDRLNLYTKSQYTASWINFNDEESEMVRKVENLETWNDVLSLTSEIYDYSKGEQFTIQNEHYDFEYSDETDDGENEYEDDYDEAETSESSEKMEQTGKSGEPSNDNDEESKDSEKDGESNASSEDSDKLDEEVESGKSFNREKKSVESYADQYEPECLTDEAYRDKETMLLDEKCKEYLYLEVPKANMNNIVTPAKRVHELITEFYYNASEYTTAFGGTRYFAGVDPANVTKWVSEFKHKNERYIGLLAKEFEMRKAAKSFSKSKLSDTGDIDINKLASYKFDDNIFRKIMSTPKGKNHGLVLLLDRSGSMSNNMSGSIEQIIVLAMFCRKVNIPFVVYGFGDCVDSHMIDKKLKGKSYNVYDNSCFELKEKTLALGTVYLREYINSKMNNSEFSNAIKNMIILKKAYEGNRWTRELPRPPSENLYNTPLTQAVYATGQIMRDLRKQYNLDLTSLVIVHDGDSDSIGDYLVPQTFKNNLGETENKMVSRHYSTRFQNVILRDNEFKYERKIVDTESFDDSLITALDWFSKTTNSKVFGFFITSDQVRSIKSSISYRYVGKDGKPLNRKNDDGKSSELFKKIREEKFLVSHNPGYDSFYLILGGDELKTENEELEIEGKVTTGKLKNAFMKMNKRKAINRVLVSRFIQGMAA